MDCSPDTPWRVVFPGARHGSTHRPRNTAPVTANLGLRLDRCPPVPTRDPLPVGCQPSTHPCPGGTAVKDGSTDGARDKHPPPSARQPLQPSRSPAAFSAAIPEEKVMPFPSQARELQFTRNLAVAVPALAALEWGFAAPPRWGHCGLPGGERGDSGTVRLCRLSQISRSFPSPSLTHLLLASGMPADEDPPPPCTAMQSSVPVNAYECIAL